MIFILRYIKLNKMFIIFVFVLVVITFIIFFNKKEKVTADSNILIDLKEKANVEKIKNDIIVEVKGAVNNPGVYTLKENSRVNDLIILAGGFSEGASTDYINLSKKLTDEMVIKVYSNEEILKSNRVEIVTKYVEKECNCPSVNNDACINITNEKNDQKETITSENNIENSLVDINNATKEQLMTLPSIGEAKAEKIISYRNEIGKFKNIEEMMNVSGIGQSLYDKIKEYIKV